MRPSTGLRTGLLLALAGALALAACGEPARDWPEPSPALWEVSGEHGEKAWLFGTIHALPDGVEWRTPEFERAFAASELLMVEIGDLDDSRAAAQAFEEFATTPGMPALTARARLEDRPAVGALMVRAGMDDADFWDTETWAAALILANAVRESETGNGVDRDLLEEGKPVEALETFAAQFARFDRLSEAEQRQFLAAVAREAGHENTEAQAEAWLTGDLAALASRVERELNAQPALREALLVDRNDYFAARIVATIEEGREPFVAVGAGHMLGPDGLPALLAERGYAVRRVQ
jgi:uncharacterized protein YbaP (TraB family)